MSADAAMYSSYWYRVASLNPRIQPGTRIHRQVLRKEEWFVFSHPVSGKHYRLNRKAYELVGRLDGEHSLDTLWNGLQSAQGDDVPTQDEVIAMLAHLMDAGLLLFDTMPDWSTLKEKQQVQKDAERRSNLNPFAFRLKLFNPSSLLEKLSVLQPLLWHPITLGLWIVVVGWGVLNAVLEWNTIRAYGAVNLLTPRSLLLAWLAYPVIKALHELSHAMTVRHWGGDVKEAGLAFFVMVPAPYVDASDATAFPNKWQRIAVSSAGIAMELLMASLALMLWLIVENGIVRDLAFTVMAIGGLSTLIFNANPLLRFDGYYILCDLLELPNLGSRSQRWWNSRLRKWMKKSTDDVEAHADGSERTWLFLYTPASWLYRISISFVIVQWVATKSLSIAFIAMAWLFFSLLIRPVWSIMHMLFSPSHPSQQQWKTQLLTGGATACVLAFILGVPIPASTVASGVVWLPENAQIRSDSDGIVTQVVAKDGQRVAKGDPLIVIEEPALLAKKSRLEAQILGAGAEQAGGWLGASQSSLGRNAFEDAERLERDLEQVNEKIEKLTLRAGVDGIFVAPHVEDLLDRHILKGSLIAYVLANTETIVRVAVPQDDIGSMKGGVKDISIRLAEKNGRYFDGGILRVNPSATTRLPSIAMGDKGGGKLITDPADHEGLNLMEPVFLVDVQLKDHPLLRSGGRAWVRFEHEARPIAQTIVWRFRQLFLRTFSIEGK